MESPETIAGRLRELPPSCGPVRLVAVDGYAGSGKSTVAARLSRALGGAPVVHLDDLATHEELFGWTGRLHREVLAPLALGGPARHRIYDWTERCFDGVRDMPAAPVVLLEGVGSGRRAVRPHLAHLVWLDVARETAEARGRLRDGPGLTGFWDGWMAAQDAHFAGDPSRPFADLLVSGREERCVMRPGPARTPRFHAE